MTDQPEDQEVLELLEFEPHFHRIIDSTEGMHVGLGYRVVEALTRLADPDLLDEDAILDTLFWECNERDLMLYLLEQLQYLQEHCNSSPATMARKIGLREFDA